MNYKLLLTLLLGITLTSCTSLVPSESTIVTKDGLSLVTMGSAEAATYYAIKRVPESQYTFSDIADRIDDVILDDKLTSDELKQLLREHLNLIDSKYRTYSILALDLIFEGYENRNGIQEMSLTEYRDYLSATSKGIRFGIMLYNSSK